MVQLSDKQIEAQINAAIKRQPQIDAVEPKAIDITFDDSRFIIHFNNGATFSFLAESVEAIATLPTDILATVALTPSGKGLRWDEPDIDLSIQGLLLGIFGSSVWMKEIAAQADKLTSKVNKAASRANGKKDKHHIK